MAVAFTFALGLLLALLFAPRFVALALLALLLFTALLLRAVLLLVALAGLAFTCVAFALAYFTLALALLGCAVTFPIALACIAFAFSLALLQPAASVVVVAKLRLYRVGGVGLRISRVDAARRVAARIDG